LPAWGELGAHYAGRDVVVRKLGVPGQPELAMGVIAAGGVRVLNEAVMGRLHISAEVIEEAAERERVELQRREQQYRGGRAGAELTGRTVVLVDDGLATGTSMRAAVRGVRTAQPEKIVVAVPVGATEAYQDLEGVADDEVRHLLAGPGR